MGLADCVRRWRQDVEIGARGCDGAWAVKLWRVEGGDDRVEEVEV